MPIMFLFVYTFLFFVLCREDGENDNDDDKVMDLDASKREDKIAQSLVAADVLGKGSKGRNPETDCTQVALEELDMDNYDEEDDGIFISLNCLYYIFYLSSFGFSPEFS